jgi:hypothetical protein
MLQNWHIRSRAHACAQTEVPFEDGQPMITAIYFDAETGGYLRRDISLDAWEKETTERKAIAHWRTAYSPTIIETKPEVASKEGALALLQRFIEEDEPATENARYILALMLERKRTLIPTATKEVDGVKMLFYENKKSGEVFVVRDPELRLDELAQLQDEVAMLLGFGGPAADAAKAVGMKFTPEGSLTSTEPKAEAAPAQPEPTPAEPEPQAQTATDPESEPSPTDPENAETPP